MVYEEEILVGSIFAEGADDATTDEEGDADADVDADLLDEEGGDDDLDTEE